MRGDGRATGTPYPLRVHQRRALDAIEAAESTGSRRAWVVLPPGAGKTLVGLETARRRGRTTVVLGPNTAIQSQWLRSWEAYGEGPGAATRAIETTFTALTYQSLATFDDHDTVDDGAGDDDDSLIDGLHPNGKALIERLKTVGDLTLVLDECHHLLEVWGRLLQEVLDQLPDAFVLGLTATPPSTLTLDQSRLVDELFGKTLFSASIPAVVREGDLAPFAELAWLTTPTPTEADWLAEQGERFAELTTALSDPAYGSTSFFAWLDTRFLEGWPAEPALTDAALRMVHAGLLSLPPDARLAEQHRHPPTAEDWVLLLEEWVQVLRRTGRDDEIVDRVKQVLPSVGYQLTRRGIRRGRSPVDRVLARVDLSGRGGDRFKAYSLGMKQRLGADAARSNGCWRAARPRPWPSSRSRRPSSATSATGCGCWCSATTNAPLPPCPPTSTASSTSRPAPPRWPSSTC